MYIYWLYTNFVHMLSVNYVQPLFVGIFKLLENNLDLNIKEYFLKFVIDGKNFMECMCAFNFQNIKKSRDILFVKIFVNANTHACVFGYNCSLNFIWTQLKYNSRDIKQSTKHTMIREMSAWVLWKSFFFLRL